MATHTDRRHIHIAKRKNGTWEGKVTIGTDSKTGKLIRKSVYGRTKAEVSKKIAELTEEAKACPAMEPEVFGITVGEWMTDWLDNYLQDIKPGTKVSYKSLSENHIIPFLGSIPLRQLRAPMIQKFYNQLRQKGLSPKYIKNIHGCLHRALDMAIKVEYIEKNYSSFCSLPRGGEQEINPLDTPEQKRLFDALKGHEYEALIITAIFTGMRCGELIGLTWDCIDFDNGTIYIKRQLTQARVAGAPFEFGSLKNGKTRTIMPAPFVMKTLAAHKEDQERKKKAAGDLWDEGEFPGLVFTHADGSHLSQPTVWKQFQKILKAAGLEHHRVHDLRHTFAVNSIMAGDDIKTLQENMGHYSAAFTLDRYGHVTATMRQASANRMQAFIDAM